MYRANKGRRFEVVCEECGRELDFKQSDEVLRAKNGAGCGWCGEGTRI